MSMLSQRGQAVLPSGLGSFPGLPFLPPDAFSVISPLPDWPLGASIDGSAASDGLHSYLTAPPCAPPFCVLLSPDEAHD